MNPARKAIAVVLRESRAAVGRTQADVAGRIGRAVTTISSWESGHRVPGLDDLGAVADAYGLTPAELAERVFPIGGRWRRRP